jgi:hypothetical protein
LIGLSFNSLVMKKIYIIIISVLILSPGLKAQPFCPNNLLTNAQFSNSLTGWSQYGTIPTATVLNALNGCLDTFLIMQATNNSNCGVSQPLAFHKDSCYSLCYCVEFPFSGSPFNAKLTIAAITPGITVTQLLTGSFTPSQAQIIDVVTGTSGFPPYTRCPGTFKATGNFTGFVVVNETIGNIGTDVRVDNVCLIPDVCGPDCANVQANYTWSVGPGYTVNFTDASTSNPGDVLSWYWSFGDPGSGINNTSTLQNPTHIYPSPGPYVVCLIINAVMTNGLTCSDTLCLDLILGGVGFGEENGVQLVIAPNPAREQIKFIGNVEVMKISALNTFGQNIFETAVTGNSVTLQQDLPAGVYSLRIFTPKGIVYRKLIITR